jgi:hypothetical protein
LILELTLGEPACPAKEGLYCIGIAPKGTSSLYCPEQIKDNIIPHPVKQVVKSLNIIILSG